MLLVDAEHKTSFIKKIFGLDTNNKFKNKAQRYQHILMFFLTDETLPFKITDIQEGVLYRAPEIFKVDKNRKPYEIKKNQNPQFNGYLEDLERWGLVISSPAKSAKGGIETREYRLSKLGKTFALIIEYVISNEKMGIYKRLFEDWKSYLTDYSTSLDLFCLKYLDKCKESGLYNEFADFFIKNTVYVNPVIRKPAELFTQMTLVRFNDKEKNQTLYGLWKKSLDELEDTAKELFLNHMSIHINRAISIKAHDYARYELKRYQRRNNSDCVISEFCCSVCHSVYEYVEISVSSYMSFVFNHPDVIGKKILACLTCKKCEKNKFEMVIFSN